MGPGDDAGGAARRLQQRRATGASGRGHRIRGHHRRRARHSRGRGHCRRGGRRRRRPRGRSHPGGSGRHALADAGPRALPHGPKRVRGDPDRDATLGVRDRGPEHQRVAGHRTDPRRKSRRQDRAVCPDPRSALGRERQDRGGGVLLRGGGRRRGLRPDSDHARGRSRRGRLLRRPRRQAVLDGGGHARDPVDVPDRRRGQLVARTDTRWPRGRGLPGRPGLRDRPVRRRSMAIRDGRSGGLLPGPRRGRRRLRGLRRPLHLRDRRGRNRPLVVRDRGPGQGVTVAGRRRHGVRGVAVRPAGQRVRPGAGHR